MLSLSNILGLVNVIRSSVKNLPLALGLSNFHSLDCSAFLELILSHRRQHCQDIACAPTNRMSLRSANQLQHLTSNVVGGCFNRFFIAAIQPIEGDMEEVVADAISNTTCSHEHRATQSWPRGIISL
jgi:hypothetical protein